MNTSSTLSPALLELKSTNPVARTAIHEAGHAVIAHFLRVNIRDVTIVPKKDYLGRVQTTHVQFAKEGLFDDSLRGVDRAERRILVCFAGQIAQRKFAPRSSWRQGGRADHDQAMELFWHIAHQDEKARNLQLALLWRKAECLVESRWKSIEATAKALLSRQTLTKADLQGVIGESLGLPPLRAVG